jgi:valyl-tRNA synthetase
MLIKAKWPTLPDSLLQKDAQDEMNWVVRFIASIRSVRAELNVPAAAQVPLQMKDANPASKKRLQTHQPVIMRLARLSDIKPVAVAPKGSVQSMLDEAVLILPLADVIDLEQERARLTKESEKLVAEIRKLESKLSNKDFVDRAPPEVVEEQRERKTEAEATLAKLQAAQKSLSA